MILFVNLIFHLRYVGTGTRVGDPEECNTLDKVFCAGRGEPLLIGSVKSSIGHSESSSGLCSITKVLLAFESGIFFNETKLQNKRLKVFQSRFCIFVFVIRTRVAEHKL